jgi:SPP1 family predicted phage head-tail adaptor
MINADTLDRRITIERPVADNSFDGAGSGTWEPVATVWANVQDALPSRAERLADGLNIASRPARIRIRFRTDITPAMRFVLGDRIMQITAGPAEIGNREGVEFMAENYSTSGNPA